MEEAGEVLPGVSTSPIADYSPVISRLDLLADRVMAVRTAVQAQYTKDHVEPKFPLLDRPETAIDRVREQRAVTVLNEVDALVMGGASLDE